MEISEKNVSWSNHLELYFRDVAEKGFCYAYLHKKAEASYSYYRNLIDLPVIVLSTALGTLSIGGETLFGENEKLASVCVGAGSIFVGILSTVGTYFGFSKRTEAHKIAHIEYSKLYRFLQIELALPVEERMTATDLLKMTRDTYERLQEIAPLVPHSILNNFKKNFSNDDTYKDIAKPSECNGLEKVNIYKETENTEKYQVMSIKNNTINTITTDNEIIEQDMENNVETNEVV